jgi:hypothetical protein
MSVGLISVHAFKKKRMWDIDSHLLYLNLPMSLLYFNIYFYALLSQLIYLFSMQKYFGGNKYCSSDI